MTFSDIVNIAIELGFVNENKPNYYSLKLNKKDNIVELTFPDDSLTPIKLDTASCSWKIRVMSKKDGDLIYEDWSEFYEGTGEEKLSDMKEDVLEFVHKFSAQEFQIVKKSVFSIFGLQFMRHKELEFLDK